MMQKLTYTSDKQIINDAAKMLLKVHLEWSNSLDSMPHDKSSRVDGAMTNAIFSAKYTPEEWQALPEYEKVKQERKIQEMFGKAVEIADRKWKAAMAVLGFGN